MDDKSKKEIIDAFKQWWRDELAPAHRNNTIKLQSVKELGINPFLWSYRAHFFKGKADSETLAQVLLYPRMLGTSISTSFGARIQSFITRYFSGTFGSQIPGIDIEFTDRLDGRVKYCQLKAGPNVINHDDVTTVRDHFNSARRIARTNHLAVQAEDYMFCLLYGEQWEKNTFVRAIEKDFPVVMGKDFWHRFTGDPDFFNDLVVAVGEVANEFDSRAVIDEVTAKLAKDIEDKYPDAVSS